MSSSRVDHSIRSSPSAALCSSRCLQSGLQRGNNQGLQPGATLGDCNRGLQSGLQPGSAPLRLPQTHMLKSDELHTSQQKRKFHLEGIRNARHGREDLRITEAFLDTSQLFTAEAGPECQRFAGQTLCDALIGDVRSQYARGFRHVMLHSHEKQSLSARSFLHPPAVDKEPDLAKRPQARQAQSKRVSVCDAGTVFVLD